MHEITPSVLFLLERYPTIITLHGAETFLSKLLLWKLKPGNFKDNVYDKKDLNMAAEFTYLYFNFIQKLFFKFPLKNPDLFISPTPYIQHLPTPDISPLI